jgi:hypothetical protein
MPTKSKPAANRGDHPVNPDKKFIGSRRLRERYNDVSHMWVVRQLANDPTFPRPVKIGRLRFWDLDQLEAYERSRVMVPFTES